MILWQAYCQRQTGGGIHATSLTEIWNMHGWVLSHSNSHHPTFSFSFRRNQLLVASPLSVLLFVRTLLILGLKSLSDDLSLCTPHLANTRSLRWETINLLPLLARLFSNWVAPLSTSFTGSFWYIGGNFHEKIWHNIVKVTNKGLEFNWCNVLSNLSNDRRAYALNEP